MSLKITKSSQAVIFKKLMLMSGVIKRNVREVVLDSSKAIQKDARSRAPSDTGRLRRSIQFRKHNEGLTGVVYTRTTSAGGRSGVSYAHLVEWGSGSFYNPVAVGRRGGGGPYRPPAGGLLGAWAKRKGLPAFPVARGLGLRGGVKGRPFLFPAFQGERPRFTRNLKRAIWNKSIVRVARGAA